MMGRNFNYANHCSNRHENGNCLVIGGFCGSVPMEYCNFAKELTQYRQAEENGLLLRLPFDVDSEIYVLTKKLHLASNKTFFEIEKFKIDRYIYNSLKNFVIVGIKKYTGREIIERHFYKGEIGKIIFEKYAEAEQALQKLQEGKS